MKKHICVSSGFKTVRMVVLTLVIVLSVVMITGMRAKGEAENKADGVYYDSMEDTFETVLRDVLNRNGYQNAGINISSIIYPDGTREYRVAIHHDRFDNMSESECNDFLENISSLSFTNASIPVNYSILK